MTDQADPLYLTFQLALAGRYSIDRELGRGGMGIVYLAREVHLDRLVAIKLLPPERAAQPSLRERFLREARLAAKLSHPNIIPIHSVEDIGGFVFYVMAFVDGESLAQRVRRRGPMPSSEGTRVLREVAWALAHAHGQGLVHRDVKPDNILIESETGRVLVADFGIAAATGHSGADGIAGTPEFMSPEQALGKPIDARSDLYGLGATAFFLFSGRFPFEGATATEILAKQVTEPPPPLASLGLAVPRKLASLVDRCLAKDPEQRAASAQALAEQLGVALEQRRELPAALRNFVKRSRLGGSGTLLVSFAVLPAAVGIAAYVGPTAGWSTLLLGATAVPLAYFVAAARRLTLLGFTHGDIGPAFKSEIEQAREELAAERRKPPSAAEKWLARLAKASAVVSGLSLGAVIVYSLNPALFFGPNAMLTFGVSNITLALSSISLIALRQRYSDVDTEFWSRMWTGKIGRFVFSMARRLVGNRVRMTAITHRATELSIGMAAEELFENLPKETRQALGDLPAVLRRLQDDAQALRKRHDELQEALSDAGPATVSSEYGSAAALRDAIHVKLGDAVAALETIRLNLLRLHAGSATVEGLTTHLNLASEVSEEVERLIAAKDEVERTLKFPRIASPSPA